MEEIMVKIVVVVWKKWQLEPFMVLHCWPRTSVIRTDATGGL